MKLVCLDYGEKRTGVAVSDPGESMAFPRGVLFKKSRKSFFEELLALLVEEEAQGVVVGLPLLEDGSDSLATRRVRNFARSLKRRIKMPVFFVEEAFSSFEAEDMLRTSRQKPWLRDGRVDSLAAARILEYFLNQPEHLRQFAAGERA
jgi:putative Holliday junction resolvase